MRTTLTIDDDVLAAAREIAAQKRQSVGEVVSDLARRSLQSSEAPSERSGIPLLPVCNKETRVTLDLVNKLRDELM
jgi:hypothetical protein